MVYHVIIALNSVGKRKVGDVISVLEKNGLELVEIRKKSTHPREVGIPNMKFLVIQQQLKEHEAMKYYREKFSESVLNRKFVHFLGNHIELFFESGTRFVDPHELWEVIRKEAFGNDRKLPIMFVVITSGEDGINIPLIPDNFYLERQYKFKHRTLLPLQH